jgi:hypothetical protein
MKYIYLLIAIFSEVIATSALKAVGFGGAGLCIGFLFHELNAEDHTGRHSLRHMVGRGHCLYIYKRLLAVQATVGCACPDWYGAHYCRCAGY